jgi:NADPH:quinone reductase-like Zn-dependent oxidoreductase
MKAVEIRGGFGIDHLALVDRPEPEPGAGEVLIAVRAVALNYRDLLTVEGRYNPKQPLPLVPCSDAVGEVVGLGPDARRFALGDRVMPIFAQRWIAGAPTRDRLRSTLGGPLDGTLAERLVLPETGLVRAPVGLDDLEASTLPCSALTAWNALVGLGPLRAGDVVLVQGTGGVSIFALQLARLVGARVIVTSSSDAKLERARSLGAWQTINYRDDPDWGRTARRLTGGNGVDLVVDVGGAATLPQSIAAAGFGARISLVGSLSGGSLELDLVPVFMRQIRLQGVLVGHRESLEAMTRAVEANGLKPVIDRVFALEEAAEALRYLSRGEHFGKICVRV